MMNIVDRDGVSYQMLASGGAALDWLDCMEENYVYEGWFLFPPGDGSTTFWFRDQDNGIRIGPITLE